MAVSDPSGRLIPTEEEPLSRKVVTSLLWHGSASLVGQVISWLATLLVIRILSPGDYGLVAMSGICIGFLMLIGDLGVGAVVVQAPELKPPELKALSSVALLAYVLGAMVAFVSAPVVAAFFAEPRLIAIVRVLSISFVFAGLYAVPQALVLRTLEFDRKAKIEVLATVASSIVALTLALRGWGVWALVGAALAIHAFRAAAFQIVRPCLFLSFPSFAAFRSTMRFGGLVTVDRILWFGYTNLDIAIAGRLLSSTLVGVYSVALSLAALPLDKVLSIVTPVAFSAFSRAQHDRESLRHGMLQAVETVSLVAFPTFIGMATVAHEALAIFVGPKWAGAIIPFQILCLVLPFRALGAIFAPALYGTGRPRVAVENNAITFGAVAVALVIGVHWGVVGLCVGWLAGYLPVFCVTTYRSLVTLEVPIGRAVAAMGIPLAAALAMGAGVVEARILVGDALAPAAELASLSLLGAGIYSALIAALRPQAVRSFWPLGRGNEGAAPSARSHVGKSSKEGVKTYFDGRVAEWAGWYSDKASRTLEAQNLLSRQRLALEMVEATGRMPSKILDVGCATGELTMKLMGRGYTVWGLDISEAMISHARDRWATDRFQVGDTEHIPFGNNMFDVAVCLGVIEYQGSDEQTLREIWRVLKPGGRAVISTPSAVCPLYHMDRAVARLEAIVRPLYYLAKYRLRGKRAPADPASSEVVTRRYSRRSWLQQLRSVGLEPEEWICHGWGWYTSRVGEWVLFLSRQGEISRRALERLFGRALVGRVSDRFVRNRALNWLASEQLVRVRAVK